MCGMLRRTSFVRAVYVCYLLCVILGMLRYDALSCVVLFVAY